jgi:hypothetical protein
MDLRLATLKAVSFYLLHNVSTLDQCRKLSCVTVVCKHFKPLKMDLTEGPETSANINQTLGKHPKVNTVNVCKHFASYQGYPNYRWDLIRKAKS